MTTCVRLQGGKIITGNDCYQADLWVKHGKIDYIKKRAGSNNFQQSFDIKEGKSKAHIYDISGCYILPGFIRHQVLFVQTRPRLQKYSQTLWQWVENGFTSFADVISRHTRWKNGEEIAWEKAAHNNSFLDYCFQFRVNPIERLTNTMVKQCGKNQIKNMILSIKKESQLKEITWHQIGPALQRWGIALQIEMPNHWKEDVVLPLLDDLAEIGERYRLKMVLPYFNHAWMERYAFHLPDIIFWKQTGKQLLASWSNQKELLSEWQRTCAVSHPTLVFPSQEEVKAWGIEAWEHYCSFLCQIQGKNIAKLFNLYPKKASLFIGSDADLLLFKPNTVKPMDVMVKGRFIHRQSGLTGIGKYQNGWQ